MTSDSNSTVDHEEEAIVGDEDSEEYSRRSFMETAAAAGTAGAAAGLAGCVGGGGSDGTSEPDFVFWTMRGVIQEETEGIREAATGFEDAADQNVNVSMEVINWDNIFQEWESALQSRSLPNVSEMACEHAVDFGYQGAAEPNTDLFEKYDGWYDAISKWGRFDGEFWGMPWFMELRTNHVNMDILEEAGVDSPPETWEEIVTKGQTIAENTDVSGAWTTPGAQDTTTGQNVFAFNYQSGGTYYDHSDGEWSVQADSAASLFTHLWVLSMREEWDIAPGGWGSLDSIATQDLYREGDTAIAHVPADLARSLIDPQEGVNEDNQEVAEATELAPMPAGPNGESHSFMGGSCLTSFTDQAASHDAGTDLSMSFIDYMTQPEQLSNYFPVSAPNFLPVREGQEEMELFTNNPTEIPDSWIETRLSQAPNAVRYGTTGAGQAMPFMGSLEGSTTSYSVAISDMIGNDTDPKTALHNMANNMRSTISDADYIDQNLSQKNSGPSLNDAPDMVQDWITGNGKPQIYNPY